eukprot:gene385-8265_t
MARKMRASSSTEALQNWAENLTYQMCVLPESEITKKLASPLSLLKMQATRNAYMVVDHAAQIFGGRAITQTGMGDKVEGLLRSVKY